MPSSKLTTMYIVRHAESDANVKDMMGGDTDLTTKGEQQTKILVEKFKHIHFDAIYSSDRLRAKKTAQAVALEKKLAVMTKEALKERSYGVYEGQSAEKYRRDMADIFKKMESMEYEEIKKYKRYESFETDEEMLARFITTVRELAITYEGKTVLVVSHGGLMRALLIHLGYADHKNLAPMPIENTGYIKIETDGVDFFLREVDKISKKHVNHFQ